MLAKGYYDESEPQKGFPSLSLAGQVVENILLKNPNNPGALHLTIHSYDQPFHAQKALDAAYRYRYNSLAVPHAIHMPAHIFSGLGLWKDLINANVASLDSAYIRANSTTGDWYHGSFYLQFGLLQLAMDCDAAAMVAVFQSLASSGDPGFTAEGAVRVPVMYLIETRDWMAAASFDLMAHYDIPSDFWVSQPYTLVTSWMMVTVARAILAYPKSAIEEARQQVDNANELLLNDPDWNIHQLPYWRLSFNVMVASSHAWETFRLVSMDAGIAAMLEVVALQETSWYPEAAHTWDANEQLAEMYLIRDGPGDVELALSAYEHAMLSYPNRYHTLAGGAKCAETLGDVSKASLYYTKVGLVKSYCYYPFDSASY